MFRKFMRWVRRKDIRFDGTVCKTTIVTNWTRFYPHKAGLR